MDDLRHPQLERPRRRWWRELACLVILLLVPGLAWYFAVWVPQQVQPDPHPIVLAMFPQPQDAPRYSDDAIIRAIKRFGNVNGYSENDHLSFVAAAVVADRPRVFDWLIAQGADPNPRYGLHPLLETVEAGNFGRAKRMLDAGCRWSARVDGGATVEERARERHAGLLERLGKAGYGPDREARQAD
jgi:hypothetical protein